MIGTELILISIIAGILTVLSPCVLPVLPVILGTSLSSTSRMRPVIITASLGASVIVFTLILKASTLLIDIPESFWQILAGGIIFVLGIVTVFPKIWDRISIKIGLERSSQKLLGDSVKKEGVWGDVAIGFALGPIFSSCSPTYGLILATILPQAFLTGMFYLLLYTISMVTFLLIIALFGQSLIRKLKWAANPNGLFRKGMGVLLVIVGLIIMTGLDKDLQTLLLEQGLFNATQIEIQLLK